MGIYVYTLRKAKSVIWIDGLRKPANHIQYAWKVTGINGACEGEAHRQRLSALAYRAFEDYSEQEQDENYAVETHKGKIFDGAWVYRNLTNPIWRDTRDTPGEAVGSVRKISGRWVLTDS